MASLSDIWFNYLEMPLNLLTILLSAVAVVYWVRLFKKIMLSERHDEGWLWIFSSVLTALLLNMSALLLSLSAGSVQLAFGQVIVINTQTLEFVTTASRSIMAVSLAIGTYILYKSMAARGNVRFMFAPVKIEAEVPSESKPKFDLKTGTSYLVIEGKDEGGSNVRGMDVFADSVTHGVVGFCATRRYPPKVREEFGLVKTPMVWLTEDKTFKESIHPADLTELSHMSKDFIQKGGDTIVLINGIEYLMMHNSFEDVLRLLQGLDDVVVQNRCRLVVSIDPEAITQQQFHFLSRELTVFN